MTSNTPLPGLFIVLEGIDGAGTTTQTRVLSSWFKSLGRVVFVTREPSDGPIGNVLRQMMRGRVCSRSLAGEALPTGPTTMALLFAADRIDHIENEITPHLEAGHVVICDRYVLSSLAYQSVDVDLAFVSQINSKALQPDITIFLDIDADIAMKRVAERTGSRDSFETLPFQKKVAANYRQLIDSYPVGQVARIDGTLPLEEVSAESKRAIEAYLQAR